MVYGNIHYGSHPGAWPISERSAQLLDLGKADQRSSECPGLRDRAGLLGALVVRPE
jgi:hypothetical protein